MLRLALCTLLAASLVSAGGMPKELVKMVGGSLLMEDCWGKENAMAFYMGMKEASKKCMATEPSLTKEQLFGSMTPVERVARDSADDELLFDGVESMEEMKEKIEMFRMDLGKMKEGKVMKMSNLSCVMQEMKFWNPDNSVNIGYYLSSVDEVQGLEPTFVEDIKYSYNLCYKMSEGLPVEDLKQPYKRMFFKQYMFQKCATKKETELCVKKKLAEWTEAKYGKYDEVKAQVLGLPKDKYEAAFISTMVKYGTKSEPEKFVKKFIMNPK